MGKMHVKFLGSAKETNSVLEELARFDNPSPLEDYPNLNSWASLEALTSPTRILIEVNDSSPCSLKYSSFVQDTGWEEDLGEVLGEVIDGVEGLVETLSDEARAVLQSRPIESAKSGLSSLYLDAVEEMIPYWKEEEEGVEEEGIWSESSEEEEFLSADEGEVVMKPDFSFRSRKFGTI